MFDRIQALGVVEIASLLLLASAAWSPFSAPTVAGLRDEGEYSSIWSVRLVAGLNLFEIGFAVVALLWITRALQRRERWSFLDSHVLALGAIIAALVLVALQRSGSVLVYEKVDLERLAVFFAGYLLVARLSLDARAIRLFTFALASLLVLRFAVLTVEHGIIGSTNFATLTGRLALVITEDVLLVVFALSVFWGLYVDRLLERWSEIAVFLVAAGVAVVDFLSLRRGALVFIAIALFVRSARALRRFAVTAAGIAAVVVVAALVLPERYEAPGARREFRYTVESTLLRTADASTKQRTAELRNYARNVSGPGDVLLGRGLGAAWNSEVAGPLDAASYGSGETAYVRLGWHVLGLDWLYKFGVLGLLGVLLVVVHAALALVRRLRLVHDATLRSLGWSLAVVSPLFLVLLFTNPRLAVFAGVGIGLVSKIADTRGVEA